MRFCGSLSQSYEMLAEMKPVVKADTAKDAIAIPEKPASDKIAES